MAKKSKATRKGNEMSYPYGPESYPTFETLEHSYTLDMLRNAFYYELHRIKAEKIKEFERIRLINVAEVEDFYYDFYQDEPTAEDFGLAFSRALEYAMDGTDDMRRFFQDLFRILEDKTVSKADIEQGEWAEEKVRVDQLLAFQKIINTEKYREGVYRDSIAKLNEKRREFRKRKINELQAMFDELDELVNADNDGGLA